jgi:hypothetical protein
MGLPVKTADAEMDELAGEDNQRSVANSPHGIQAGMGIK